MKFVVSQETLAAALSSVSKSVSTSSTLPILAGVLIKAQNGILEFQTSNYTTAIRHRIAARIEEAGATVLPCKKLLNITKILPDMPVTFELVDHQMSIRCGKSTFRLNTLDPSDFPEFPTIAPERSVELPANILSDMVGRVWRITSKDKARPVIGGVYMVVENNTVRLVATDSYRLAVCDTHIETSSVEESFELIVPAEAFNDALSITDGKGSVVIQSADKQVVFVADATTYVSRRVEGTYPNYKSLLPQTSAVRVKMKVDDFNAALRRVTVVAQNNSAVKVSIDADAGTLTLSSVSSDQDAAIEVIEAEVEGESGTIAFNHRYLTGCTGALTPGGEVTFELQSYAQPGVFKSADKINYVYLLMPVRI